MLKSSREHFNPLEWLAARGADTSRLTFDPAMGQRDCQYRIVRGTTHDGTKLFEDELLWSALKGLTGGTVLSYYKPEPPRDEAHHRQARYVVGPARLATAYGTVTLPVGSYPGERQRIRVPVRCILPD